MAWLPSCLIWWVNEVRSRYGAEKVQLTFAQDTWYSIRTTRDTFFFVSTSYPDAHATIENGCLINTTKMDPLGMVMGQIRVS
jgi:hypothetical protein